jgi:CBS domain-containing protein
MADREYDRFNFESMIDNLPYPETVDSMTPISDVFEMMLDKNYSQVPVVEKGKWIGTVTLLSVLRKLKSEGDRKSLNERFMDFPAKAFVDENSRFVKPDEDILEYADWMAKNDFVIVGSQSKLLAIFTNYDMVHFFKRKSEAFLLLREIETILRYLVSQKIRDEDLKQALERFKTEDKSKIRSIDELTLNDLRQFILMYWGELESLFLDRERINEQLEKICRLRNQILHFRGQVMASNLCQLQMFRDSYLKLTPSITKNMKSAERKQHRHSE